MNSRQSFQYGLFAVAGCLVMGLLYARSTSVDLDVHNHYDRSLHILETVDTRLSGDVLRLRYGLLRNYDGVVADLEELGRLAPQLLETPDFLDDSASEKVRAAVRRYTEAASVKAALVERFKSTNGAMRGSLLYFPIVSRQLIDAAPPALARIAGASLDALLQYEVSGVERDRIAAIAAIERLGRIESSESESFGPLLETTLDHARNVLSRRAELDELIEAIEAPTTRERIVALQRRYAQAYAVSHQRAEHGRWMLFLVGALAIALTLHTLRALAGAKSDLEQANRSLDRRVRERTQELSEAKTLLERDADRMRELNEELETSNRELDDFAYIASHDLKEPLRGIHNYANFLIEDYADKLDEEGRNKLETLSRLAGRMDGLIETLLHFSRVGRTELAFGITCIQDVVEGVVDSLHISLEERGVEIRIPETLPSLYCDSVRVTEVFRNLISNALKYNDKSDKWIEIGFLHDSNESHPDKEHVVFYVRDNGIGIREKHIDSVFKMFKRLHGRDKFGGGTGAGLTIVKKIVERHGGHIWIESQQGEGTTFYFDLGGSE